MSHEDVYAAVKDIVPCRHMEWPNDSAPAVPFACYYLDYDRPICVDDVQVGVRRKWFVELYEKRRDATLEETLANSLRTAFGSVRRDENWVENDNLLQVTYTFYEIEGDFDG